MCFPCLSVCRFSSSARSRLTTALYPSFSPFLGTDPVFATKKSLVCELEEVKDENTWTEMGWTAEEVQKTGGRAWVWKYDFVLPTLQEVEVLKKQRKTM